MSQSRGNNSNSSQYYSSTSSNSASRASNFINATGSGGGGGSSGLNSSSTANNMSYNNLLEYRTGGGVHGLTTSSGVGGAGGSGVIGGSNSSSNDAFFQHNMNSAYQDVHALPPQLSPSSSSSSSTGRTEADRDNLWYFTADQLANSPSRRNGIDADQELSYRQMTACLIQEMGQRLQVSQLCINTAIVYMHRFYAFHSFTHFHRNGIAAASLFLAAKVEEQPHKLEHVIRAANKCLNQAIVTTSDPYYQEQSQDLVFNENVLLQTLGFDVAIDHPHTHVVKACNLVKGNE